MQGLQEKKRTPDFSLLQNFEVNTTEDWAHWDLDHEQFEHIPLGFSSRYNFFKNTKYCDINSIPPSQDEIDYRVVQGTVKKKNKQHISKNVKLNDRRQPGNTNIRVMTKRFMRNLKPWHNQIKTNFKKITVKNDWTEIKTINKTILEGLPKQTPIEVTHLKTVGKLHHLEPKVERISWQTVKFKENKPYEVESVSTGNDKYFNKIVSKLAEQGAEDRINVVCHPNFLFALLTIRGGVYPWNIKIEKDENFILLQSYKGTDETNDLTYLDLFTVNQNTTNNMPMDEAAVKKTCVNATKMTRVFQDLLASGEEVEIQTQPDHELFQKRQKDQEDEQEEQEEEEQDDEEDPTDNLEKLRKYLKISLGKIDVYSYVQVDGAKVNQTTGQANEYLIRTFMESETQGAWCKDMKVSPGTIITKEYHSNNCSIQKWICEAKLAGVNSIKTGFMGYEQGKPALLNVNEITVEGMESILSFKTDSCWSVLKYVLDLLAGLNDGVYILSRAPYTNPLSIKLYKMPSKDEDEQDEEQEPENN